MLRGERVGGYTKGGGVRDISSKRRAVSKNVGPVTGLQGHLTLNVLQELTI